ncbi:MAG: AEC family transporter [Pseudomonadota bacterium]
MDTLLSLTAPVFIVIGLGWAGAKWAIVPIEAARALNAYVFTFAMPALIVRTLGRQPADSLVEPRFFAAWFVVGLSLFGIGALITRIAFKDTAGGLAVAGQAASVGNIGFLGVPLVLEAFGPEAAGPLALALTVDLIVLIPLSILILEAQREDRRGLGGATLALKGAILNPFLLSIIAGLGLALMGVQLPGPADRTMAFLGAAAGPTALFALGLSLAGRRAEGDLGPSLTLVALKLLVHPAALMLAMAALGVDPGPAAVGLVLASLPVAGNVFVIAERYGTRARRASTAVVLSTIIAVGTVTIAIEFAGGWSGS